MLPAFQPTFQPTLLPPRTAAKGKPAHAAAKRAAPVPRPGLLLGLYPQRGAAQARAASPWWWPARAALPTPIDHIRLCQRRWQGLNPADFQQHLLRLRAELAQQGWQGRLQAPALGCAAAVMQRCLGLNPFDSQLFCAQALLAGQLAEMATGEGKTLAVALAAAVAALAGVPVHAMTANDYLAERDAQTLAPFFAALGLCNVAVTASTEPDQRRAAYAGDITHCSAREVAFDHLRDQQALKQLPGELQRRAALLGADDASEGPPLLPQQPLLLRGLCLALVDEADSLLIDEATLPLVLAEPVHDPALRAACFQALALARGLQPGEHVHLGQDHQSPSFTAAGQALLVERADSLGGAWHNSRHRQDLVASALVALHRLQRDTHYLVRDGQVQLLDTHTGRAASGRVWSQGLQTLVELKEGLSPSTATQTCAQGSYQRFFARYWHLAGTSGTLAECRRELQAVYGLPVVAVPLRKPCLRQLQPARQFANTAQRLAALPARVAELVAAGRPVLVGVASVAAASQASAALMAAGIEHRVLDARHDRDEASIVAAAGQASAVTVATALAGRGTDIVLGAGVAAAGGLHVIVAQDNRSARLDRQLLGRAARQGDPGSAELWQAPRLGEAAASLAAPAASSAVRSPSAIDTRLQSAAWWRRWQQQQFEWQEMRRRRRLMEQETKWEQQLQFKQVHA